MLGHSRDHDRQAPPSIQPSQQIEPSFLLVELPLHREHLAARQLDRLWHANDMPEDEAITLAVEAQHATRRHS